MGEKMRKKSKLVLDGVFVGILLFLINKIEEFCFHHEFFHTMSKRDQYLVVRNHLGIIRPVFKSFWNHLHEFYFSKKYTKQDIRERDFFIEKHLNAHYELIKNHIEAYWKYLDENYSTKKEFNQEVKRNKDFILQEHCEIIRKGMDQLWRDFDQFSQKDEDF